MRNAYISPHSLSHTSESTDPRKSRENTEETKRKRKRGLTVETFNLEQEPLQPTPFKPELFQLFELARSVDLGVQCELGSFDEVCEVEIRNKRREICAM
jgi:hypothetical protein